MEMGEGKIQEIFSSSRSRTVNRRYMLANMTLEKVHLWLAFGRVYIESPRKVENIQASE